MIIPPLSCGLAASNVSDPPGAVVCVRSSVAESFLDSYAKSDATAGDDDEWDQRYKAFAELVGFTQRLSCVVWCGMAEGRHWRYSETSQRKYDQSRA